MHGAGHRDLRPGTVSDILNVAAAQADKGVVLTFDLTNDPGGKPPAKAITETETQKPLEIQDDLTTLFDNSTLPTDIDTITFLSCSCIPEPAVLPLLGTALVGLSVFRRRSSRAT